RIELEEVHGESEASSIAAAAPDVASKQRERWLGAAALVTFLASAVLGARLLFTPTPNLPVQRFEAVIPPGLAANSGFQLSPDGLKVAYVTTQPSRIWVRPLDSAAAEAIPSTDGITGSNIFWSPNSQDIGFFAEGKLKRVA